LSKKVGIIVSGGAVSMALLNKVVSCTAHSIRTNGGIPFIFSGGYSSILSRGNEGIYEITDELIDCWKHQEFSDYIIDRTLPYRSAEEMDKIICVLREKSISRMIIIGGNGSSYALTQMHKHAPDFLTHLIQILKTMDGDCQKPFWNLGFASTLHHAKEILRGFSNELSGYGSPYIIKILGREVGQLAFNLGLSLSEQQKGLILIREEFSKIKLSSKQLSKLLVGSSLKKLSSCNNFGPLLIAEGMIECLTPEAQAEFGVTFLEGRVDFSRINLEVVLKDKVSQMMKSLGIMPFGVPLQIGSRGIGYSSRAGDPIIEDIQLAVEYGTRAGLLSCKDIPLPYPTLLRLHDEIDLRSIMQENGEAEQCWVKTQGPEYETFKSNQYRLLPKDLKGENLKKITAFTKLSEKELHDEFRETAEIFESLPR